MLSDMGLNVIGVPKTIDNDIYGTDITFGFDTAVNIATDAIDRLHSTASSHRRVMVIELMGHHAGWITLYAGMAGGADIILLPELGYNMKVVIEKIKKRMELGKAYSIVAVAKRSPKPKNIMPTVPVPATIHSGRARKVAAKRSPEKISMDKYKKLKNCKISASTKKASIGCSASGRTNWTKNEMKNKIAFGLIRLINQALTNGERTESATRSTRPSWASIVLFCSSWLCDKIAVRFFQI